MSGPRVKLWLGVDDVTHWVYPMAGSLTVCGRIYTEAHQYGRAGTVPTCVRCIALVQAEQHGDGVPWMNANDPTKKLG